MPRLHWAQGRRAPGVCNIRAGYSPSPGVLSANQGPTDPGPHLVSAPVPSLGWWPAPAPGRSAPTGFCCGGKVSAFLIPSHGRSSSRRGPHVLRRGATRPAADHGQDRTAVWDGDGSCACPCSQSPRGCGQWAAAGCGMSQGPAGRTGAPGQGRHPLRSPLSRAHGSGAGRDPQEGSLRALGPGGTRTGAQAALWAQGGGERCPLTRPLLPAAWSTTFGSRRAASRGC